MLVSFVLRVVPTAVNEGGFVGQVEAVASGERRAVGSLQDLLDFCREICAADRDLAVSGEGTRHASTAEIGQD